MFNKEVRYASKQVLGGVSAADAVVAVGIDVHVKLLVCLYQCFAVFGSVAQVYIVVRCTMYQQQRTMQVFTRFMADEAS